MSGGATAEEYHDTVVCLGLAADVVPLMSACPNEDAREAVLAVHAKYINDGTCLVCTLAETAPPASAPLSSRSAGAITQGATTARCGGACRGGAAGNTVMWCRYARRGSGMGAA